MGLWGPKEDSEVLLEPFVLASAGIRVDREVLMQLSDHLDRTFGKSSAMTLKAFASNGYVTSSQLDSFGKDVGVPTWDSVLIEVKKENQFGTQSSALVNPAFPSTSFQVEFHQRVNRWAGLNTEWNTFLSGLVHGYMGAAFDVMNENKPRMKLGNRLVLEGCFRAAAAVVATQM